MKSIHREKIVGIVGFGKGFEKKDLNGGGARSGYEVPRGRRNDARDNLWPCSNRLEHRAKPACLSRGWHIFLSLPIEILSAVPYLFLRSAGNERCRKTLDRNTREINRDASENITYFVRGILGTI